MKKILLSFALVALVALAFTACTPKETTAFDPSHLYSGSGDWTFIKDSGQGDEELLNHFNSNGTGYERNLTQNTPEQSFRWELVGQRLTFIHNVMGVDAIPRDYIVLTLNEYRLEYKDEFDGKIYSCSKERGVE
jgi:hypothetical protein